MKILGIETSCDETALALVEANDVPNASEAGHEPQFKVLSTALNSQIDIHKEYGGVFPSLAKREHARNLVPLMYKIAEEQNWKKNNPEDILQTIDLNNLEKILEREQGLYGALVEFLKEYKKPDVDYISVTCGPGLEPALWVGVNFAKVLSLAWNIPLIPTNHMEGHIVSVLVDEKIQTDQTKKRVDFPALALLISGGHTQIVLVKKWGDYEIIGETLDDAVGEAYDKVARMFDLPYPGGPGISKMAELARKENLVQEESIDTNKNREIKLPRPMIGSADYNFSFSGLKTAVLYLIKDLGVLSDDQKKMIAKEFEQAVVDVLVKKVSKAVKDFKIKTIIVGGGVIANAFIRENLSHVAENFSIPIYFPTQMLSTDNAVMIAVAGYFHKNNMMVSDQNFASLKADGNLRLS